MTKTTLKSNETARLLGELFDASFNERGALVAVVDAIKAAIKGKAPIDDVRHTYCAGQMARLLDVTREEAARIMGMKGAPKAGTSSDEQRTQSQERAYASARMAWARRRVDAGLDTNKAKGRKGRAPGATKEKDAPLASSIAVQTFKNKAQLGAFLSLVGAALDKTLNANSALFTDEDGAAWRGAIEVTHKAFAPKPDAPVAKPRTMRGK